MAEHIWRIYRYYNPIEDKSYIGQTTKNVNERAAKGVHYCKGTKFREAIDKYGWDTFEQSILRLCTTQKDANYWEKHFIDKFNSIENGYNTQIGGSNGIDWHHSKETRKKLSESFSGEKNPMYGNHMFVGVNNPMYGRNRSGDKNPMFGRSWYNNGIINVCININTTEVPTGFVKGMIKRRSK